MPSNSDVGQPEQDASAGPQRTHPLTVVFGLAGAAVGFGLDSLSAGVDPIAFLIGVAGAFRVVGWCFKTYELGIHEMIIVDGVFTRRRRVVPYQRIQQIDMHRGFIAQVCGLAAIRIDTAGDASGRVELSYLHERTATSIREYALARRTEITQRPDAGTPTDTPTGTPTILAPGSGADVPLLQLVPRDLMLAAITGPVTVAAASITALAAAIAITGTIAIGSAGGFAIAFLATLGVSLAAVAFTTVGQTVNYARFRMWRREDDLAIEYGLFEVQHLSMPRRRVQFLSLTTTPFQRAFGLSSISVHSAAASGGENQTRFTIPALPTERVHELLNEILTGTTTQRAFSSPALTSRPPAARRRAIVRRVVCTSTPGVAAAIAWFPFGIALLAFGFAGWRWGEAAHRHAGYAIDDGYAVFARGVVIYQVDIVVRTRVQSTRTTASPLQRRAALATLKLDLTGKATQLADLADGEAIALHTAVATT